jgi:hypothetical protein
MRRLIFLILCSGLWTLGSLVIAQDAAPIQVAFIENRQLRTTSITDPGEDGITRLAEIFRALGAETQFLRLDEPIPTETDLVVMVRPSRRLSPVQNIRLWQHLQRGKHLLLALDPDHMAGIQATMAGSGLNNLLLLEYGLGVQNSTLIEPWLSLDQLASLARLWSRAQIEDHGVHPVIAPLQRYDLPLQTWGAASIKLEPLGLDSLARPLFFTETPYGETSADALRQTGDNPPPLVLNIGEDLQGRLLVGGLAVNYRSGSRLALLGDSEMLQNLYGLAYETSGSNIPRFPGNRILAERLAAWLMGLPEEAWPPLPGGITWLALDGAADDWEEIGAQVDDALLDAPANDIQSARAFQNDQYVYILLQAFNITPDLRLEFTAQDFSIARQVIYEQGGFYSLEAESGRSQLPDAGIALGDYIEIRLPRRALGSATAFSRICVGLDNADCIEDPLTIQTASTLDPVPVRPLNVPLASVANSANLRLGPATNTRVQVTLPPRTQLTPLGRDSSGEWILLRNGRWQGWINIPLLNMNIEAERLPVIVTPQ